MTLQMFLQTDEKARVEYLISVSETKEKVLVSSKDSRSHAARECRRDE